MANAERGRVNGRRSLESARRLLDHFRPDKCRTVLRTLRLRPYTSMRNRLKPGGRPREVNLRAVIDGIFQVVSSGCAGRMLPHGFPPSQTFYDYFNKRESGRRSTPVCDNGCGGRPVGGPNLASRSSTVNWSTTLGPVVSFHATT